MQRRKSERVPLDSSREPVQKGQYRTVDDVDIYQMTVRRTGVRAVRNHRHHYVVVLFKLHGQQCCHQCKEHDIKRQ